MSRQAGHEESLHGSNPVLRLARGLINRVGPLRRLVKSRPVQDLIYTLRVTSEVEHPGRFLRGRRSVSGLVTVKAKRTGSTVLLRPRSGDLVIFHQVMGRDCYGMPPVVLRVLGDDAAGLRIADLGGNIGMFTADMLARFPDAHVVALEADPSNAAVFDETITLNGWEDRVDLKKVAAMTTDGQFELAGGEFYRSRVIEADEGSSTSITGVDVLPLLADRDLIKIDIEGSEWPILADPRFAELPMKALALEWHEFGCPSADPVAEVESLLAGAGFEFEHEFIDVDCGTLWAWKTGESGPVN